MSVYAFFSRPIFRGVWVGLVCAVAAGLLSQVGVLRGLEEWLLDACFSYRDARPTRANIVLIGLDEASLDELGKPYVYLSPELAEVVTHVKSQGAAAIGIDLFIPETLSTLPGVESGEGDASLFGQAVADAGNVVLPQWHVEQGWGRPVRQWQYKSLLNPDPLDFAFVNQTEDDDQFVRRQQLLLPGPEGSIAHLALALFARARGESVTWDEERRELRVGAERIPLDAEQKLRINFVGPPGRFAPRPFRDVLAAAREDRPLPELKGATVLIGLTGRMQQDYHPTPYANHYAHYLSSSQPGLMAGTEIHAHILATLHDRAFLTRPLWLHPLPWLLVTGIVLGRLFSILSLEWGLVVAVVHHFAWKGFALLAFTVFQWRVDMVAMLLLGALAYGATFALRWRQLRRMMGVVKSEAVTMALEADPRRLHRSGDKLPVTVLFADIRSFTDFSEKHEAAEVVTLLNAYFSAVVPLIEAEGGTIDKFIGDGLMVLYNAPASCPDHAVRAVRSAVAMVRRVHELQATWARLDRAGAWAEQGGMRIGVGVHTGVAVVGAIGSPRRLDYTAIGDTVNAAARIESENKRLGTEILISAATHAALPAEERARLGCADEALPVQVKGKQQALVLYRVDVEPAAAPDLVGAW
jgi:adenylate cyclase